MFGLTRTFTPSLVGWLWADLLLGLFAIFLAASSVSEPTTTPEGIDPRVIELAVPIDGPLLLGADASAALREQERLTAEVLRRLVELAPGRRVAVVIAFASHASPGDGDRLARAATAGLSIGPFAGALVKQYHDLVAGDDGRTLSLELYLYH